MWGVAQIILALAVTCGVLAWLLLAPPASPPGGTDAPSAANEAVSLVGSRSIRIDPSSPISQKLDVLTVKATTITDPVMTVTGTVAASLRPGVGKDKDKDSWQFNSPEVLTAYTDWQKAILDITFTETQAMRIRELAVTRNSAQTEVVERLRKLVSAGTDSLKDLRVEETNKLQYKIQGDKDVYEADTAVRNARKTEAALARQLQQAGLDPGLITTTTSEVDLVMAEVPEGKLTRVMIGQGCQAQFFGIPGQIFSGKVVSLSPVVTKDRRTLRVLFIINDPKDQLRPGMFAEIGLGTDARQVLRVSADSVVHADRADYVLIGTGPDEWRITEVQIGELFGSELEILSGVKAGDRVIGKGAVLLKPVIVRAVRTPVQGEVRP
ncbi:putative Co/Zn/Cd efflux system membrane fusion protein [Fimbriiglobus ruber]|uniref:Putative Co/Zn/Cd efflux system membrane fusion protein n=1 Tax=Fimbriiglobus ruber TaxID=1908690 RepID=A0A225CYW6_9BACT|nr:putative Co/Zn/Cd efflux system membrane fusion protein [Fimbriiglobus ruber]